jgi:precorrin-2 dehydrogenase/sirohydrochlorin ferrochelatase
VQGFPIMLDVRGRLVVIVGGGVVGARKARGLFESGADRVRCVSPAFCDEMPERVDRVVAVYQPSHVDDAKLVFAATDSADVNAAVVRDALERGILVSRADGAEVEPGEFTSMAVARKGEIALAVSAGGQPALAATIRDELSSSLDAGWGELALATKSIRPQILRSGLSAAARRAVFRSLASRQALSVLKQSGPDALLGWLRKEHPGL